MEVEVIDPTCPGGANGPNYVLVVDLQVIDLTAQDRHYLQT